MNKQTRQEYIRGVRHGVPIGLGYFAVSFAIGITAKKAGMTVYEATLMSLFNLTSAGQAAAITLIGVGTYIAELALTQLIINARYFLMSCSLSQKVSANTPFFHRLLVAFGVTDEIFGISVAQKGYLKPAYNYGAMSVAIPGWCLGTALGVIFGEILPPMIVNCLSVALYGMFIAIIIPPTRKSRAVGGIVIVSMALSYVMSVLPLLKEISSGFRIIIITVAVAAVAAAVAPVEDADER